MRVVAGKHRGRVLAEFSGRDVRPTSDRAREALFDILAFRVPSSRFLDAFAGTGAVGIEAFSRGAAEVVFLDSSPASVRLIEANLAKIGERADVRRGDAADLLGRETRPFDLAFFDPPYASSDGEKALRVLAARRLLAEGGTAVLEKDRAGEEIEGLEIGSVRKYGKNVFTFYGYKERT